MTLAIDPKHIAAATAALKAIPNRANKIPVAQMLHLEAAADGLVFTATDCDLEASFTVEGSAKIAPVCLPPHLLEAAAALTAPKVELAIDEGRATAKAGRSRFSGSVLPGSDFPRLKPDFDSGSAVPGKDLAAILNATVGAASNGKDGRYYLEGVCLQTLDGRLHATATDGHRMYTANVEAPAKLVIRQAIVPVKTCNELVRLAGKSGAEGIILQVGPVGIAAAAGNERIVSKLIDGTYPDWRRVIPGATGNIATFDVAEMVAALHRVMKVQDATAVKAKEGSGGHGVRLREDGDMLVIETPSDDATDAVRAEFAGKFGLHGVNGRLLAQALSEMKERGGDTVSIDIADRGSPMRLESPTDEDFLAIVMPMRV